MFHRHRRLTAPKIICMPNLGGLVLDLSYSLAQNNHGGVTGFDICFLKAVHFLPFPSIVNGIDIKDIVVQWYNNVM